MTVKQRIASLRRFCRKQNHDISSLISDVVEDLLATEDLRDTSRKYKRDMRAIRREIRRLIRASRKDADGYTLEKLVDLDRRIDAVCASELQVVARKYGRLYPSMADLLLKLKTRAEEASRFVANGTSDLNKLAAEIAEYEASIRGGRAGEGDAV